MNLNKFLVYLTFDLKRARDEFQSLNLEVYLWSEVLLFYSRKWQLNWPLEKGYDFNNKKTG